MTACSDSEDEHSFELDEGISAAAKEKYENWKKKSQLEIKRSVRQMMGGKSLQQVTANFFHQVQIFPLLYFLLVLIKNYLYCKL